MVNFDESIARLLRLAGPREAAAQKRSERVRTEVWAHWRAEIFSLQKRMRLARWGPAALARNHDEPTSGESPIAQ